MATILIAGLGAMGGLWAARLASRHQVHVLTRASDTETLSGSISLTLYREGYPVFAGDLPLFEPARSPAPDLILLACKTWQTAAVLSALNHPGLADRPVVIMQNGMATQMQLASMNRPVLAATTTEAAYRASRRTLHHVATGRTRLGALNTRAEQHLDEAAALLASSGLETQAVGDIWPALWSKVCINCGINPYTALLNVTNGEILESELYRTTIDDLCQELAHARMLAGCPATADALRSDIEEVARATAQNTSSMLADVKAGRPTEIEAINGFIVDYLRQAGQPAPVNSLLTQRIRTLTQEFH
ncbi:MAG: 2-dehydropantoate 2-reductase [Gammaproteobacteria bacterium]|nr:MAG: 2-dehydropantoate 2-reductase [Gammaproteobacteria bacterium]